MQVVVKELPKFRGVEVSPGGMQACFPSAQGDANCQ